MNKLWNGIKSVARKVVFLMVIGGYVLCFFGGAYIATEVNGSANPKADIMASLNDAFKSTKEQPVVVVVPEPSLWERVTFQDVDVSSKDVVYISTKEATQYLLGIEPDETGVITRVFEASKATVLESYNWWKTKF